jgi:hypothetical protein
MELRVLIRAAGHHPRLSSAITDDDAESVPPRDLLLHLHPDRAPMPAGRHRQPQRVAGHRHYHHSWPAAATRGRAKVLARRFAGADNRQFVGPQATARCVVGPEFPGNATGLACAQVKVSTPSAADYWPLGIPATSILLGFNVGRSRLARTSVDNDPAGGPSRWHSFRHPQGRRRGPVTAL